MLTTQERILNAAVTLFSRVGFNAATTREIASLADVNEVTIYRYYPRKRDLFIAALDSQLNRLQLCSALNEQLAGATDLRSGLQLLFELVRQVLLRDPELLRLMQFSVLEFGDGVEPVYKKHLDQVLECSVISLQQCGRVASLNVSQLRTMLVAFAGTVIGMRTFYPIVWGEAPAETGRDFPAAHAEMWASVLGNLPVD